MIKKTLIHALKYYKCSIIDARYSRALFTKSQWQQLAKICVPINGALCVDDNDVPGPQKSTHHGEAKYLWYPFVYERVRKHNHGSQTHLWAPDVITPVVIPLSPSKPRSSSLQATGAPRFARDCLEPNGSSVAILGSLDDADEFYNRYPLPENQAIYGDPSRPDHLEDNVFDITSAREYAKKLLSSVATINIEDAIPGVAYKLANYEVITPSNQQISGTSSLIQTLDALETLNPNTPCLESLTTPLFSRAKSSTTLPSSFSSHDLWGRAHPGIRLSDRQNSVISACLRVREGNTLAIHGPPGTGKTTLLTEVIASILVMSALTGEPMPLIALSSTNNQAIRNAMNWLSLATDERNEQQNRLLHQRWIPWTNSLAYYDASRSALDRTETDQFATLNTIEALEQNTSVAQVALSFIQNARLITQDAGIGTMAEAISALRRRLKVEASEQVFCRNIRRQLKSLKSAHELGQFHASLQAREARWERFGWMNEQLASQWRRVLDECRSVYRLFEEADAAKLKQEKRRQWVSQQYCEDVVLKLIKPIQASKLGRVWADKRLVHLARVGDASGCIDVNASVEDEKVLRRRAINGLKRLSDATDVVAWQELTSQVLNEEARAAWVWLAIHIREGEWLQLMEERDPLARDGRTFDKVKAQLYRRSLVAPVLVATLHRLPKVLSHWDVQRQAELPLFNELDWLIVDEAGQCAPDVAAPSVSLTKRLIAIGDLMQLEPVWSVEEREDVGNRIAAGLVQKDDLQGEANRKITESGGSTSSGSLLALAQHTSQFVDTDRRLQAIAKGIWLTEHRRCHPDIAEFCNELAYQNQLDIKTTPNPKAPFPAICLIDSVGLDKLEGGSRSNIVEARMIGAWLAEHQERITEAYGRPIYECVAILTPFKAQAQQLDCSLTGVFGKAHGITCGTVHSLQGAQRPIVILSLTYAAYPAHKSFFFDRSKSMLNVAVSRAQDTLIVAGDLDCLSQGLLPSQLLGKHLLSKGQRLEWPAPDHRVEAERWRESIKATFGANASIKLCKNESALKMALEDPDINHIVLQASGLTHGGLHKMGNLAIAAVRRGATVQWMLPYEMVSQHPKSKTIMEGLKIMASNGVTITYSKQSFRNTLILPEEQLAFWAPSSWLNETPPTSVIGLQNDIGSAIERLENVQGVRIAHPQSQQTVTQSA